MGVWYDEDVDDAFFYEMGLRNELNRSLPIGDTYESALKRLQMLRAKKEETCRDYNFIHSTLHVIKSQLNVFNDEIEKILNNLNRMDDVAAEQPSSKRRRKVQEEKTPDPAMNLLREMFAE
jgi:septation ring formation regulator EzrA